MDSRDIVREALELGKINARDRFNHTTPASMQIHDAIHTALDNLVDRDAMIAIVRGMRVPDRDKPTISGGQDVIGHMMTIQKNQTLDAVIKELKGKDNDNNTRN